MGDVSQTRTLQLMTDSEVKDMAIRLSIAKNSGIAYNSKDVSEELRYREQKRIAKWVAWLVGGTLLINVVGIVANIII